MPISYDQLRDLAVRNADAETHPGVRAIVALRELQDRCVQQPYAGICGDPEELRDWCSELLVAIVGVDNALGLGLETSLAKDWATDEIATSQDKEAA